MRILALCMALVMTAGTVVEAKQKPRRTPQKAQKKRVQAPNAAQAAGYASAIVVEIETGKVLFEKSPDIERAPASITKMMTQLLALEALDRGLVSMDEVLIVPAAVRHISGSRIRVEPGERILFREALRAMSIASANDAAAVLAERIGGSQAGFVSLMNSRARELGMMRTRYVNPHGLDPRTGPVAATTARDQAILARKLLEHPLTLEVASMAEDTIRGGQVIRTTNRLLGRFEGLDGLKTGYTSRAGFCLVSTAQRNGMRVVSVLLGAPTNTRRFSESEVLLTDVFSRYERVNVIRKGQDLGKVLSVPRGSPPQVRLVAGEDVAVLLPVHRRSDVQLTLEVPAFVPPPLNEGNVIGEFRVMIGDSLAAVAPAVAAREVRKASVLDRLAAHMTWFD